MKLYTCSLSRGLRVTWVAEELGIDLDIEMLPFPPRIFDKNYFNINPMGTVPTLIDGDINLTESCAIVQYLATRFSPHILSVGPEEADYGAYLDFLHHADATLTFPQTVYMRFSLFETNLGLEAAGEAYAKWFGSRLKKIAQRLENRSFLCADRFSAADIAIGYALYLSTANGLSSYMPPIVAEYLDRLMARPAFIRAVARETDLAKSVVDIRQPQI